MLNQKVFENLNLYHSNEVLVADKAGIFTEGMLAEIYENSILVETKAGEKEFSFEEIEDVAFVGYVTDYHTYKGTGEINGIYEFEVEDKDLFEKIKYLEFKCKVCGHLELQKKIVAKEVRLLEYVHVINRAVLAEEWFLYTMKDGNRHIVKLVENENGFSFVGKKGESIGLCQEQIEDITRYPAVNDYVCVETQEAVYKGLVTAATEKGFNLLTETTFLTISFSKVRKISYFGRMSMNFIGNSEKKYGMIDKKYGCKMPHYLYNEEEEKYAFDPDVEWIYSVGVNDRGLIAKDVYINQGEQVTKVAEWEIGVINFYDKTQGYIGDEYIVGAKIDGRVRFKKEFASKELSDRLETGMMKNIYVVKYVTGNSGNNVAARVELQEELDKRFVERVKIEEDTVRILPYFYSARKNYVGRQIEILFKDKNRPNAKGVFEAYGKKVLNGEGTETVVLDEKYDGKNVIQLRKKEGITFISYAEIKEIRTQGIITECRDPKFGKAWRVDDKFTLYIEDIKDIHSREYVEEGTRISFVIRDTPRDKKDKVSRVESYTECKQVEVLEDEKMEVYVTAHMDDMYTVYDVGKTAKDAYEINAAVLNPCQELDKYDYLVRITYRQDMDEKVYTGMELVGDNVIPKKVVGYLTSLDEVENKVTIISEDTFLNKGQKEINEYTLDGPLDEAIKKNLRLEDLDYKVEYEWREKGIVINQLYKSLDGKLPFECHAKRYIGYLSSVSENNGNKIWYIVPEGASRRLDKDSYQKNTVMCNEHNIRKNDLCDNNNGEIDITKNLYCVEYVLNKNNKKFVYKADLISVTAKPMQTITKDVNVDLNKIVNDLNLEVNDSGNYAYGIIRECLDKNTYFFILKNALNKAGEKVKVEKEMVKGVTVDAILCDALPFDTWNYWYVVRYHEENIGDEIFYYIDVLLKYKNPKNPNSNSSEDMTEMKIVKDHLSIKYEEKILHGDSFNVPQKIKKVSDYMAGETLLYREKDTSDYFCSTFHMLDKEGRICLNDNEILDPQNTEIYRFGVMTGFGPDKDKGKGKIELGYLNNGLEFRLSKAMNIATRNEFLVDVKKELYIYTCKENEVEKVWRIKECADSMLACVPWEEAVKATDECKEDEKNKERIVKFKIKETKDILAYYWNNNNNPALNAYMKEKKNSGVYVKRIVYPDWETGKPTELIATVETEERSKYKDVLDNANMDEYTYHLLALQEQRERKNKYISYILLQDIYDKEGVKKEIQENKNIELTALLEELNKASIGMTDSRVINVVSHIMNLNENDYNFFVNKISFVECSELLERMQGYYNPDNKAVGISDILGECRTVYENCYSEIQKGMEEIKEGKKICQQILTAFSRYSSEIEKMDRLLCPEDKARIKTLLENCECVKANEAVSRENMKSWRDKVIQHPTPFVSKILSNGSMKQDDIAKMANLIFNYVKKYIDEKNKEIEPKIQCFLNEKYVVQEQKKINVIVGNSGKEKTSLGEAKTVCVKWEITELNLTGEEEVEKLKNGEYGHFSINLSNDMENRLLAGGSMTFKWKKQISYMGYGKERVTIPFENEWNEEAFEVVEMEDRKSKKSPYREAEKGGVLEADDPVNINREEERRRFRERMIVVERDENGNEIRSLASGEIILIHGQKQCGKTTFFQKVIAEVEREFDKQAIVIILPQINDVLTYFEKPDLDSFDYAFKINILKKLKNIIESDKYKNLINVEIPAEFNGYGQCRDIFKKVFEDFRDNYPEYQVILAVDEFTGLCAKIIEEERAHGENKRYILDFIRTFKELGITQILIGHAAMMELLGQLDKENDVKTALELDMTMLADEEVKRIIHMASNELIRDNYPESYLETDPYDTFLGKCVENMLIDLSGCCPSMLTKLCHYMYEYYRKHICSNYFYAEDVEGMLGKYVYKKFREGNFEMLLKEHGDDDSTKTAIDTYMKYVAKCDKAGDRILKIDDKKAFEDGQISRTKVFSDTDKIKEIRELLIGRKVLEKKESDQEEFVKIVMGIYEKFVKKNVINVKE